MVKIPWIRTMIRYFEPTDLEGRLRALSPEARIAFGALNLERALPNFFGFAADTGAPGGAILRGALAKVWGVLEGVDPAVFAGMTASACEPYAPNTEDSASVYTSAALDAVTIACNVLEYLESPRTRLLVESASLRCDTIDLFLQHVLPLEVSSPDFEVRLLEHPLMQEELGFQQADLAFLGKSGPHGPRWHSVLGRSLELGYSNLRMTADSARKHA